MGSITSANAVFHLAIESIFPSPVRLQGFSADDIFTTESIPAAQTLMGVDGHLSGGFVFAPTTMTIALQADSASNDIFDTWYKEQKRRRDVFVARGVINLRALGQKFSLGTGYLTTWAPIPAAARVLQPRRHMITWEDVTPALRRIA